jgi:WD40 repeat protein
MSAPEAPSPAPTPPPSAVVQASKSLEQVGQAVATTIGAVTAIVSAFKADWLSASVGLVFLAGGVAWFAWWRWRQGRLAAQATGTPLTPSSRSYLRGLRPFEEGDSLPAREQELKLLLTTVLRPTFRFGYLTGQAGTGKTSLLRAGFVPAADPKKWAIVYLPRTGNDPKETIVKALRERFKSAVGLDANKTLHDNLVAALRGQKGLRLLIVCDQFEEFFLAQPTPQQREPLAKEVGACFKDGDLAAGFLLALREEFAIQLEDFAPHVPRPLNNEFGYRLRNWGQDAAQQFLSQASRHDKAGFQPELIEAVVTDLAGSDGIVRPVELQLVAERLLERNIVEPDPYVALGRARGLLAAFVKDTIEPRASAAPEAERQVARHVLRALCAEDRDVRRPTGLTRVELVNAVQTAMQRAGQGALLSGTGTASWDAVLDRVLANGLRSYLLIQEDAAKYNLAHDYLVPSVRDATADLLPVEEEANRLLLHYVERQRRDPGTTLLWRDYFFLRRHASPAAKAAAPAVRLLRRTEQRMAGVGVAGALAALLTLTLLLPPRTDVRTHTEELDPCRWVLSGDGRLAVCLRRDKPTMVWKVGEPWAGRVALSIPFVDVRVSPRAKFLAGRTRKGGVYLWPASAATVLDEQLALRDLPDGDYWDSWVEFSPDEKWVCVPAGDGKVYLWDPATILPRDPKPFLTLKEYKREKLPVAPFAGFSPKGQWLTALDHAGNFHLVRLQESMASPATPTLALTGGALAFERLRNSVLFSPGEDWLAVHDENGRLYLWQPKKEVPAKPAFEGKPLQGFVWAFSPDNRWFVFRQPFDNFYAWEPAQASQGNPGPAVELPRSHQDSLSPIRFSPDGAWVAGVAQNRGIYLWRLESPPGPNAKAAIAPNNADGVERRPQVAFSPKGHFLAAAAVDGNIYAWELGAPTDSLKPVARYDSESAAVTFSPDDQLLFLLAGSKLGWGVPGDRLQTYQAPSTIQAFAVSPDGHELVLLGTNHLTVLERVFSLWGIRLWHVGWPQLREEAP